MNYLYIKHLVQIDCDIPFIKFVEKKYNKKAYFEIQRQIHMITDDDYKDEHICRICRENINTYYGFCS